MGWRRTGRALLRPYELAVLDAVAAALPAEAAVTLQQQVDLVRRVQRLYDDREVDLYTARRGQRPDLPLLANRAEELRLATVELSGPGGGCRAVVTAVHGHVFQLAFRPAPGSVGAEVTVTRVTTHADPTRPDGGEAALSRLDRLPDALRREIAARAEDDRVLGAASYTVDLEDAELLVVAVRDDGALVCAVLEPERPGLRSYDGDGTLLGEHHDLAAALGT